MHIADQPKPAPDEIPPAWGVWRKKWWRDDDGGEG